MHVVEVHSQSERGDIEAVQFPNTIATGDFRALLEAHAPVNGVALGVTPFGEVEIAAARENPAW